MNNLDKQYLDLLKDIIDNGTEKKDRTGAGTLSVFGRTIRHKMSEGFPLLTTKKMAWKQIVTELLWFLRGETNIQSLVKDGNNIWVGDCYKNYCKYTSANDSIWNEWMRDNGDGTLSMYTREEFTNKIINDNDFAQKWGDIGPGYGKQWRSWNKVKYEGEIRVESQVDQILDILETLKTNPDSRRMMVSAWNAGEIDETLVPPCHFGFQIYTRELSILERIDLAAKKYKNFDILDFGIPFHTTHDEISLYYPVPKRAISLMWNQRSVDTPLGLPFNIASYGLLLLMLADEVGMVPDELIGSLGDTHIYLNQIEAAKEQMTREGYDLPKVTVQDGMYSFTTSDFFLENYKYNPKIEYPLNN